MKKAAIIGLGLLGTSLAMALKGRNYLRMGWTRNPETRKNLLEKGIIDISAEEPEEIIAEADITVLCLPLPAITEFCGKYKNHFRKGAVVTDVGSVKLPIIAEAEKDFRDIPVTFVGSHPMAGTENSGPDAAFPELYENAVVFLTPTPSSPPEAIEEVRSLWNEVNTNCIIISPEEHDRLVAFTSHISHLIALALTSSVLGCGKNDRELRKLACCSAFRDCTRVASSSPVMWREIIERNSNNVLEALREFRNDLECLIDAVSAGNFSGFEELFAESKKLRDEWVRNRYPSICSAGKTESK